MTIDPLQIAFLELNTPCLIVDERKLTQNVIKMKRKAASHDVQLRPHAKTAKSAQVMGLFNDAGNGTDASAAPLTVSTLKEAEYFAANGFCDLLYGVCITPDKFARVAALLNKKEMGQTIALTVILDSLQVCQQLASFALQCQTRFSVGIEIDCDGHRAGLCPEDPIILEIAEMITLSDNLDFWGVMTHGGGAYHCASTSAVRSHAEQERAAVCDVAARLSSASIDCDNVSLGSTPTVVMGDSFAGVTEIRPGVFTFFDLFQMQLGICSFADIALSVLTTVTSHKVDRKTKTQRMFIDAGGLALSKDRSTQGQTSDLGYGQVIGLNGETLSQPVIVNAVNQEHGVIDLPNALSLDDFPIGSRLRILPNHACMTAAAHDGYHVLSPEGELSWWSRCNGW